MVRALEDEAAYSSWRARFCGPKAPRIRSAQGKLELYLEIHLVWLNVLEFDCEEWMVYENGLLECGLALPGASTNILTCRIFCMRS